MMGAVVSLDEGESGHAVVTIRLAYKVEQPALRSDAVQVNNKEKDVDASKPSLETFKPLEVNEEDIVVKAVTEMIEAHLDDTDLNVQLLTKLTGYGTKLIYRRVKAVTGYTPVNYIRQMRMQRAAVLLKEGRFAVSEVMYMVGFSTQSYFSKCFNQTFGISPAEYARRNKV